MSTAIAVRPDDLDALAALYGSTAQSIRATSGQATVPLPLVPRDPSIRYAGLDERLARLSAILRGAAADVESHERALAAFSSEIRAVDAGAVFLGVLAATPALVSDAVRHVTTDAWQRAVQAEERFLNPVENGVRSEFDAVSKAVDGVGRTIAAGADDLSRQALALQRAVDSGAARTAGWTTDRWHDLTGDAAQAWHALGALAGTVQRWMTHLAQYVAAEWHTARDHIEALLAQVPPAGWGALALGAVAVATGPAGVALVLTALAADWVVNHLQPLAEKAKRYGGKLETAPPDPKAGAIADNAYTVKVDVPLPWGHAGGSVALKTTSYSGGSEDVTLNEEIFAGVGLDALKAAGLDLGVTESLQAGQSWHFRSKADADRFIARLGMLAVIAELARTSPLLAAAAVKVLQHTDPNLLRIPPPTSVSVRQGVQATASAGVPEVASAGVSVGLGRTVTVDNTGHTSTQLDGSFGIDAAVADPLARQGVHVNETATGSITVDSVDRAGMVEVTLQGDLSYETGHLDGVLGTGVEQSTTGRLHLTKSLYLPADQASRLGTDAAARAALLHQSLSADDVNVQVWAGTKSTVRIAGDLVTGSSAGEHLVASVSGRDLVDNAATVFATSSSGGGSR